MLHSLESAQVQKAIAGKVVLVRTDFNVPLKNGKLQTKVGDVTRIEAAIPTLKLLLRLGCTIGIVTHLGRPVGTPKGKPDSEFSVQPLVPILEKLLDHTVTFCPETIGETAQKAMALAHKSPKSAKNKVVLLENVRFYSQEEENDEEFAKELAELADVYVNEAFSASHRAHASIVGVTKFMPSYAGLALTKEVATWTKIMKNPKRPFVMIIGGAKISDKVGAVQHLAEIADAVLVGGGTANNFLKAEGFEIYQSYLEEKKSTVNYVKIAEHMLETTRADKHIIDGFIPLPKIIMPIDVVAAPSMDSTQTEVIELTSSESISKRSDIMFLDIGPKTAKLFSEIVAQAGTIFWNGPLGVFEKEAFAAGTRKVAKAIGASSGFSVVGGGDTVAAIDSFGLTDSFDYISVAGGASLEMLSGKTLPGIAPLLTSTQD